MEIIEKLSEKWKGIDRPFLVHPKGNLNFSDIKNQDEIDLSEVKSGDVVAIIGDFNPVSIWNLLRLIEKKTIVVPLTIDTKSQHEYFFEYIKMV